jgi:hypothetical protein
MGYDIHITRRENWYDEDISNQISLQEWKDYIESDAEMRLDNFAEARLQSGEILRVESEGLTVWTTYSGDDNNSNHAWFDFRDGNIVVKNPDEEIMRKMLSIADKLNAKMQGEHGEIYDLSEIKKVTSMLNTYNSKPIKPWWKFW